MKVMGAHLTKFAGMFNGKHFGVKPSHVEIWLFMVLLTWSVR